MSIKVEQPLGLEPFFQEARLFVFQIREVLNLDSAWLDDWHSGDPKPKGGRIFYDSSDIKNCQNNCNDCSLFKELGEDIFCSEEVIVRKFLGKVSGEHLSFLTDQKASFLAYQKYLNCKTWEQYRDAFIRFAVEESLTEEMFLAELKWIAGFRLLLFEREFDLNKLKKIELVLKSGMFLEIRQRLEELNDAFRLSLLQFFLNSN